MPEVYTLMSMYITLACYTIVFSCSRKGVTHTTATSSCKIDFVIFKAKNDKFILATRNLGRNSDISAQQIFELRFNMFDFTNALKCCA